MPSASAVISESLSGVSQKCVTVLGSLSKRWARAFVDLCGRCQRCTCFHRYGPHMVVPRKRRASSVVEKRRGDAPRSSAGSVITGCCASGGIGWPARRYSCTIVWYCGCTTVAEATHLSNRSHSAATSAFASVTSVLSPSNSPMRSLSMCRRLAWRRASWTAEPKRSDDDALIAAVSKVNGEVDEGLVEKRGRRRRFKGEPGTDGGSCCIGGSGSAGDASDLRKSV
mmetsp:Transcript_16121/g.50422  ORF Transcript_16121/g.50422 Transcript_16121/m.50422 type:complete len:226 (+) Transcript_16121:197-874(+)